MTVVMMLALVSALTMTLAVVTTNNLSSARLSQQAGAALNAADAGIAQGLTYLRQTGVKTLNQCSPTCASDAYGNSAAPATVAIPGRAGQSYKVWIEVIAPYPANATGIYRVHSTGFAGGPASRTITTDAMVTSYDIPYGIFANSVVGGGNTDVHRASILSTGCIWKRSKMEFAGIDVAYGIPAAAHSSQIITDDQGSGQYCPNTNKPIHDPSKPPADKNCNALYPYDQDKYGGPLAGTACYQAHSATYPLTSLIASDADLMSAYGIRQPVFSQAQLDQLKAIAISQDNYYTTAASNTWTSPTEKDAVMYFDLTATDPGGLVDTNFITGWDRAYPLSASHASCEPRSLVVIIEGGNAKLNSNSVLFGSLFLISGNPYGQLQKSNGMSTMIGTVYANNIDFTGTADMWLDECFLANMSPGLTNVEAFNYREVDR